MEKFKRQEKQVNFEEMFENEVVITKKAFRVMSNNFDMIQVSNNTINVLNR